MQSGVQSRIYAIRSDGRAPHAQPWWAQRWVGNGKTLAPNSARKVVVDFVSESPTGRADMRSAPHQISTEKPL